MIGSAIIKYMFIYIDRDIHMYKIHEVINKSVLIGDELESSEVEPSSDSLVEDSPTLKPELRDMLVIK